MSQKNCWGWGRETTGRGTHTQSREHPHPHQTPDVPEGRRGSRGVKDVELLDVDSLLSEVVVGTVTDRGQ